MLLNLDMPFAPLLVFLAFGETPTNLTIAVCFVVLMSLAAHTLLSNSKRAQQSIFARWCLQPPLRSSL